MPTPDGNPRTWKRPKSLHLDSNRIEALCPTAELRLRLAIPTFELGKLFTTFPLA
jgi:hypothetical protein